MNVLLRLVCLGLCFFGACALDVSSGPVTPSHGAMSGYFTVRITLDDLATPAEVDWVRLGSIDAYGLTPIEDGTLEVTVQGHPTAGFVEVLVGVGDTVHALGEVFHYDQPAVAGHATLHAIGASLTEGTQRGLPTQWSVLHGPAAQLARQLGLFFPLPVLIPNGFQEMTPDLIGPPPYCQPPALNDYQMDQALTLIPSLTDPETDVFSFALVRVDPLLPTHNVAVGGSRIFETLDGPGEADIALQFLSHMVYEPTGTIGDPVSHSQVELVEANSPEIIVSFDLLGNDLIDGMIDNADFDAAQMTPLETFEADIDRAVARLAATGAHVFLASLPNPTHLPFFRAKRARLAEEGLTANAELVFAAIDTGVAAANARLAEAAAEFDNVHVVDVAGLMSGWMETGVQVGDETLWVEQYGGLIGLDGLHFTDTAYAVLTNTFIRAMSDVFGATIPLIDVAEIWAADRERPESLRDAGLEPATCQSYP